MDWRWCTLRKYAVKNTQTCIAAPRRFIISEYYEGRIVLLATRAPKIREA